MSTIQATNLKSALSTTNNAVMTAGGDFTNAAGISYMGGTKNLLINSAMQVAQRGTSTAGITSDGYYTADRWANVFLGTPGTWTQTVESDAPTGSGLRNSLKMLCTTAKSSLSAGDIAVIVQRLEGQDVQRIAKGTASAQQLTLSFWVKSNVTGTYVAELYDTDNTRYVSAAYTVSASATWEKKTITFPSDTTGAFSNDNGVSLIVQFWLLAGSSFTSGSPLNTTWGSPGNTVRAVGQTNLAANTNNYWQITGTQLEIGSVATSFEFEPYETTLRKCQRYYWRISNNTNIAPAWAWTSAEAAFILSHPVTMRDDTVNLGFSGTANFYIAGAIKSTTSLTVNSYDRNFAMWKYGSFTGMSAGTSGWVGLGASSYLEASSEL